MRNRFPATNLPYVNLVTVKSECRIGNLFSFGLLPAISVYAGGHVLGQLLVFGVELCDLCFRYAVHLISGLLSWAGTRVSNLTEAPASSEASGIDN